MSTTATERPVSRQCDRDACDESYRAGTGHAGYCSDRCWAWGRADQLLDTVRNDHRFCASCFRRLRTITPPPDEAFFGTNQVTARAAIGWAMAEPETTRVDGEVLTLEQTPTGLEAVATDRLTRRQGCSCGTTHHTTTERSTLTKRECIAHAKRLSTALTDLRNDGVHDDVHDRDLFLDAVRKHKSTDRGTYNDAYVFWRGLAIGLLAAARSD